MLRPEDLSYWEREAYFGPADVAVIGSGIVGLNAALALKLARPQLRVVVIERGLLPTGASSRNAGFACFGSATELLDDLRTHTEEQVFALVQKRWQGLQTLRHNLGDAAIDFQNHGGFELFTNAAAYTECIDKLSYLNKHLSPIIGNDAVFKKADHKIQQFGFNKVAHMLECSPESQIDTGKMITALTQKAQSAGVLVLTGLEVESLEEHAQHLLLQLKGGVTIKAGRIIVATNGFARQLLPHLPVVPARAQVILTEPIVNLPFKGTFHFDSGYYYFRNIHNRVLFGGARNLDFSTEETTQFGLTPLIQLKLEELLSEVILPGRAVKIETRWSGIMGMGPEKLPIIQPVSNKVFCAVRLGGMGVAIGSLVGHEVAQLVLNS